jgi:hypothetical protein
VDAQQDAQQAQVQSHARPSRLLLDGGQSNGEIAQLSRGPRLVGGTGSLLELGLGQPAVSEAASQQGHGLLSVSVGGSDG